MADKGTSGSDIVIADVALRSIAQRILLQIGSGAVEARVVADHLVDANLCGHDSHGVGWLPVYVERARQGLLAMNASPRPLEDSGAFLSFDGGRGFGQSLALQVLDTAIPRCKELGVVVAVLRNAHHLGRIGAYGEVCAAAELVSIHFVNVVDHDPFVAPHGGADGRLSTNPLCIAFPHPQAPHNIVLDFATTGISFGKARLAMAAGEQLAPGNALDAKGRPTTDPAVLFREPAGVLRSFAAHKGYALAFMCELLAGVLSGAGTIQPENPRRGATINNMTTVLLDPRRLVPNSWLRSEMDSLKSYVTQSPCLPDEGPVQVPGEPEHRVRLERGHRGIPLPANLWQHLLSVAEVVGVSRESLAEAARNVT